MAQENRQKSEGQKNCVSILNQIYHMCHNFFCEFGLYCSWQIVCRFAQGFVEILKNFARKSQKVAGPWRHHLPSPGSVAYVQLQSDGLIKYFFTSKLITYLRTSLATAILQSTPDERPSLGRTR